MVIAVTTYAIAPAMAIRLAASVCSTLRWMKGCNGSCPHRCDVMSIIETIEYDADKLAAMEVKQLLCQLIAREDLRRPNRESHLNARAVSKALELRSMAYLAKVTELNVPQLESDLKAIITAFFANGDVIAGVPAAPIPPSEPVLVEEPELGS